MPNALVLLSAGCEETEAVTTIDLLTRANIAVTTASITAQFEVLCSRGVKILADKLLSEVMCQHFDVLVLPGGVKGAENFRDCPNVISKIKSIHQNDGIVAAICATPAVVLQHHNLFPNAKMTGYPMTSDAFDNWQSDRVCFDEINKVITSQGPATSIDFALKIIDTLLGQYKASEIAAQLVLPQGICNYRD